MKRIVVCRTTTKEFRLHEYIAAAEISELSSEDVDAIDEAGLKETHRHFVRFCLYAFRNEVLTTA